MNCPNCGKESKSGSKFCNSCGSPLEIKTSSVNEPSQSRNALVTVGIWILIYGVLNLLLWGGQELYYRKDTVKANELKAELAIQKTRLDQLESTISSNQTTLNQEEATLTSYKDAGNIDMYNAGVDEYNALLSSVKSEIDQYESIKSSYNAKVDQYNEIIQRSGSRWWLIPIPIPGNHSISHG